MNLIGFSFALLWFLHFVVGDEIRKSFRRYRIIEVGGARDLDEEAIYSKMNFGPDEEFEILHREREEGTSQVLVKPEIFSKFKDEIKRNNFSYNILVDDVEKLVQETLVPFAGLRSLNGESTYDRYMHYAEITEFLQNLQVKYPEKVNLVTVGTSYQGEKMTMVVISDKSTTSNETVKPVIFMEAGTHAREWISIAAAVYTIEQLANSSTLTKDVDWHIIPVSNPDGYKYTWTKNRLWRKNLRSYKKNRRCFGVDLNRNFGVKWGGPGANKNPCSELYAGYRVFSEPETHAIVNGFLSNKDRTRAYVSIHSFGQYIYIPPSSKNFNIPAHCTNIMISVASQMANSIKNKTGNVFTYGTPISLTYHASGTSMDWAFSAGDSPLVFNFELRGRGKDTSAFLLPVGQIYPGVAEFWAAMNTLHGVIAESNPSSDSTSIPTPKQAGGCFQKRTKHQDQKPTLIFSDNSDPIRSYDSDSAESSEESDFNFD